MKNENGVITRLVVFCGLLMGVLLIFNGCEQLLDQALTKEVTIESQLFAPQVMTGAIGSGPVVVTKSIQPDEEYTQYIDRIEDVRNVNVSGSATNNGNSPVTLILTLTCGDASWTGQVTIPAAPDNVLLFADWFGTLSDADKDELNACMLSFSENALNAMLSVESNDNINVTIDSILLSGTIKVSL